MSPVEDANTKPIPPNAPMTPPRNPTPRSVRRAHPATTAAALLLLSLNSAGCHSSSADGVSQPAGAPASKASAQRTADQTAQAPAVAAGEPALPSAPREPAPRRTPGPAYNAQGCVDDLEQAVVQMLYGDDPPMGAAAHLFEWGAPALTLQTCARGAESCRDWDGDGYEDRMLLLSSSGGSGGAPLLAAFSQGGCWRLTSVDGVATDYAVRYDDDLHQTVLWTTSGEGANRSQEAIHRYERDRFVRLRTRDCVASFTGDQVSCGPWRE